MTWLPARRNARSRSRGARRSGRASLFADDNDDMRDHAISRILGAEYDLITAKDGIEALEIIRENPPDLLLSDIMMPGLDGLGLLQAVRGDPRTEMLPVIFLSARAGEEMSVEGLRAGADDYLVKPFTVAELLARVGTHLKMAIARRNATEREAALRAEAEAARDHAIAVVEGITDGFLALDRDWRVTYVNAEAERLNRMSREEMMGRSFWDIFPARQPAPWFIASFCARSTREYRSSLRIITLPGGDGSMSKPIHAPRAA